MKSGILFFAGIILLFSCNNAEEKKAKRINTYFDIAGYFDAEMDSLQKVNPKLKKSIWVDGSEETQEVFIQNWKKELLAFKSSDINKPAWIDSYKIDTIINDSVETIRYTATDPDLSIRFVELDLVAEKCVRVKIESTEKNSVYTSSHKMEYKRGEGYQLETLQKVNLMDDARYRIEAVFLK